MLSKAFPLSPDQVVLPGDKSKHTEKADEAADYVMGKTDKKPAFKFEVKRKLLVSDSKKPTNLKGRKVVNETNHLIEFDNHSQEVIQFPCIEDIDKIKVALGL